MQVFINERSLNNQFNDNHSFLKAINVFTSAIKLIAEYNKEKNIFKSDDFFYYSGLKDNTHLQTALKENPQMNQAFNQNLRIVNPKSWQQAQLHDGNSSYDFSKVEYVGSSVAEISERKLQQNELRGFLLNFTNSQFGNELRIEVVKNNSEKITVDCNFDEDSINNWLVERGFINLTEVYDVNSTIPPRDYQTVLRDTTKFEKTKHRNHGRVAYRRKGTSELWAVDASQRHAGDKAHIEVFDEKTAKHLGTSLYNEIRVNDKFKVETRYIPLS